MPIHSTAGMTKSRGRAGGEGQSQGEGMDVTDRVRGWHVFKATLVMGRDPDNSSSLRQSKCMQNVGYTIHNHFLYETWDA